MIEAWAIRGLVALALLAGAGGYGYHHGAQRVQARWDKQVQADKAASDALAESNRLRSRAAAADYEIKRAATVSRLAPRTSEASYALTTTICPPAGAFGKPLELGDVPIPRAELQRLRAAGADF